jgi:hypothetical protein
MRKFRDWYYNQKAVVRFVISFLSGLLFLLLFFLTVNLITGDKWNEGISGGMVVWLLLTSYWSLSDKKFYQENQKLNNKQHENS